MAMKRSCLLLFSAVLLLAPLPRARCLDGPGDGPGRDRSLPELYRDPRSIALKPGGVGTGPWEDAPPPPPPPPPGGRIFVDVTEFVEGFSAWKFSLAQALRVVEALPGAALVEPCMVHGRLRACGGDDVSPEAAAPDIEDRSPVPAGEILDLSWAFAERDDGRPPLLVSRRDFLARVRGFEGRTMSFDVCLKMASNFRTVPTGCRSHYRMEPTPEMRESLSNPDEITVISADSLWLDEGAKVLRMVLGVSKADVDSVPLRNLPFHPRTIQTVRDVLALANVGEDFSVVHWRAERPKINFMRCAEALVEVKDKVAAHAPPGSPVVLMTPVTGELSRWDGKSLEQYYRSASGRPDKALALLKGHGYVKFQDLLEEANVPLRDVGMLVIYDLILATESRSFATCASECRRGACRMCNHLGKFSDLAAEMRAEMAPEGGETHRCWPRSDTLFRRPTRAELEAKRLAESS